MWLHFKQLCPQMGVPDHPQLIRYIPCISYASLFHLFIHFIAGLILNLLLNNWNVQSLPFVFSQPRPKRCSTHCYIACNIYMNQQLAKMNPFWPAAAGSASLCRAKPNNQNVMPSTENLIHGNPMQGSFPVLNLNSGQDKGQAVVNFQRPSQKDKSSESVNLMDPAQKKQLVLQQTPQPAPAGNLLV